MATRVVRTADILDGHVSLDVECLDRIYLNGYVPNLQVGGQVVQFLAARGFPIPSPAVVARIGDRFRQSVRSFAVRLPPNRGGIDYKENHARAAEEVSTLSSARGRFGWSGRPGNRSRRSLVILVSTRAPWATG